MLEIVPFLATIAVASLKITPPLQDLFRGITDLRSGLPDVEEALKIIELEEEKNFKPKISIERFTSPKQNIILKIFLINIQILKNWLSTKLI